MTEQSEDVPGEVVSICRGGCIPVWDGAIEACPECGATTRVAPLLDPGAGEDPGLPCPRCGAAGLEHHDPRIHLLGDHAYSCPSCGWEGFGPAPEEFPDDPEIGLVDRLVDRLMRREIR